VLEAGANRLAIEFEWPQRAVTPGQSVVLYAGDVCLGGGIIDACDAPPTRGAGGRPQGAVS
jgi:tRNA-specific 2-thiouridylase